MEDRDIALEILLKLLDKRGDGPWANDAAGVAGEYRTIYEIVSATRQSKGIFSDREH
jgi:hypothetical protein